MSSDIEEVKGSCLSDGRTAGKKKQTAPNVLWDAVECGDAAAVQQALRNGADVNCIIRKNFHAFRTCLPLYEACKQGNDEIVRILLDAGADAHWNHDGGWSAMWEACRWGHSSTVEILIHHDVRLLENTNDEGKTPLFTVILNERVDVARLLKDCGANVHATDPESYETTLMHACGQGNLEIVQMLLAAGVDLEARDVSQRTALHHAAQNHFFEAARELILQHNADMFAADRYKLTPFDLACDSERPGDVADPLLEICCSKMTRDHGRLALHSLLSDTEYSFPEDSFFRPPRNPLHIRSPLGTLKLKHWRILFHTLDTELIRSRDDNGKLPIHIACGTNAPFEVLAMLVELDSATLQIPDYSGALPLHECCRGSVDCSSVVYLVEQGGRGTVATRNHEGALPLHNLCASLNPSLRTVQYLVQSFPGSLVVQTHAGLYPFMIAACTTSSASLSVVFEIVRSNPNLIVPR